MAKNTEFNTWMNGVARRAKKRKYVGEGKEFEKGEAVGGARASYGSGRAVKKIKETIDKERDNAYMRRQAAEQREIKRDPNKVREQKKTNFKALNNIARELRDPGGPDVGSVMDFAQDYIPMDTKLGEAARKEKNKAIARKTLARRNK